MPGQQQRRGGGSRQAPRQQQQAPAQTSAVTTTRDNLARVDAMIQAKQEQLAALAGDARFVERLRVVTLHALANPNLADKLARADLATVIEAVREAAVLGLSPTGANGEGYLIPYWNRDKGLYDIQFQAGYRGLQILLEDTALIATGVAYEGDQFDYMLGTDEWVRHVPALRNRGNRIAFWAAATLLPSGVKRVEVMDVDQVEQRRKASKAADSGPWVDWYDEMGRKTVLRGIAKRIPLSARADQAISAENEAEGRYQAPPAIAAGGSAGQLQAAARGRQLLGMGVPSISAGDAPAGARPDGPVDEPASGPAAGVAATAPDPSSPADAGDGADGAAAAAGDPGPVADTAAPAPGPCGHPSPYGDGQACTKDAGHAGNHIGPDKSSWAPV